MTVEVPASVGQRLLWLMDHYRDGDTGSLNEPLLWRIRGCLDIDRLQGALTALVARHEALRTTLTMRGRRLTQVVHDAGPAELPVADLRSCADPEATLQRSLLDELTTRIDPTVSPIRVRLWRTRDDEHALCLNMHHLTADFVSLGIASLNLAALYNHAPSGGSPLPPVGWQYRQWTQWQNDLLGGATRRELESYWSRALDGMRVCPLPTAAGPSDGHAGAPATVVADTCLLTGEVADGLRRLAGPPAKFPISSMFPVALSLFYVVVYAATGQDDVTVASMFDNRRRPEIAETVGFFENILLVRGRLRRDEPFADLVSRVRATIAEVRAHQDLPFHLLAPQLTRSVEAGDGQRADAIVVNVVHEWLPGVSLDGAEAEHFAPEAEHRTSRFGLRVVVVDVPVGIHVTAVYSDHVTGWVRDLTPLLERLAARVATDPGVTVAELGRR